MELTLLILPVLILAGVFLGLIYASIRILGVDLQLMAKEDDARLLLGKKKAPTERP